MKLLAKKPIPSAKIAGARMSRGGEKRKPFKFRLPDGEMAQVFYTDWWGLAWPKAEFMEVCSRIRPGTKRELNTLIHEALHLISEEIDEDSVKSIADSLSEMLWNRGYRVPKRRK